MVLSNLSTATTKNLTDTYRDRLSPVEVPPELKNVKICLICKTQGQLYSKGNW
jgi:hypothetical protein